MNDIVEYEARFADGVIRAMDTATIADSAEVESIPGTSTGTGAWLAGNINTGEGKNTSSPPTAAAPTTAQTTDVQPPAGPATAALQGEPEKNKSSRSGIIQSPLKGEKRKISEAPSADKAVIEHDSESEEEVTPPKVKYFRFGEVIYASNKSGSQFEVLDPNDGCDSRGDNDNNCSINNPGLDDNDTKDEIILSNDADFNETNTNATTSFFHTTTPAYCPVVDDFAFYHCDHSFSTDENENDRGCCGCGLVDPGNQTCSSGPFNCPDHQYFNHQCSSCLI
jgi:hypothetical protein